MERSMLRINLRDKVQNEEIGKRKREKDVNNETKVEMSETYCKNE